MRVQPHWTVNTGNSILNNANHLWTLLPVAKYDKGYQRGYITGDSRVRCYRIYHRGRSCAVFKCCTILASVKNGYDILILRLLTSPLSTKCLFLQCLYRIYSYLPLFFTVCKPFFHNIFLNFVYCQKYNFYWHYWTQQLFLNCLLLVFSIFANLNYLPILFLKRFKRVFTIHKIICLLPFLP